MVWCTARFVKPTVFDSFKISLSLFYRTQNLLLFPQASLKRTCLSSYFLIHISIPSEYFYAYLISTFVPFHEYLLDFNNNNNNNNNIYQFPLTFSYFLLSILLSDTLNPISIAAIPLCLFTLNPYSFVSVKSRFHVRMLVTIFSLT